MRARKNLKAGHFQRSIESFRLHLRAERKATKTVRTYVESAQWFAAERLCMNPGRKGWEDVVPDDIRHWMIWLLERYSDSYANNQYRALQQFFKWWAAEEELPDPMKRLNPPQVDTKLVPIFTDDELSALVSTCEGRSYVERRDSAIIALFRDTGMRLSELAGIRLAGNEPEQCDLDLEDCSVRLRGKGGKERRVRYRRETARMIDRYIRTRVSHAYADHPRLWLGTDNRPPMTANGIYQMIRRRGNQANVPVHPHKFRHHFTHTWLDRGGPEGDLMALNGWSSRQMLTRYGASARAARALRTYDRIMDN